MADLTTLEEKLGEVAGLAAAAQGAAKKVEGLLDDDSELLGAAGGASHARVSEALCGRIR
jgi:hypothetical protein